MDRRTFLSTLAPLPFVACGLSLAGCGSGKPAAKPAPANVIRAPQVARPPSTPFPVLLGIDTLERQLFAPIIGKRCGLLTHSAAVNRLGTQSWQVLHRAAPRVQLRALYAPEHGLDGQLAANEKFGTATHQPTGLPVYSVYGKTRKPTPEMLQGIDVLLVDLQDIGSRSYTFISAMRLAAEACFELGKEVIILDRPNPLGGLKVDGPPMDSRWMSYVGGFQVPYVHGLTIGELARLSLATPGMFQVPAQVRQKARLSVIPMQGWRRSMRWPDTGLPFQQTSPFVPDFAAAVGYAMIGLGCELSGFSHGMARMHPFRTLQFRGVPPEKLKEQLDALRVPGLGFRIITLTTADRLQARTVYVDVLDWNAWRPTELSFKLHRLGAKLSGRNPFARATPQQMEMFNKHVGSQAYWDALVRDAARVDVDAFFAQWLQRSQAFQGTSRVHWLYT